MMMLSLIQSAYSIRITASGGGNGESGSISMNFDALESTAVDSQIAVNGADITPCTAIIGPTTKFEQVHDVRDASGKYARVYVKVLNAINGLTYSTRVQPKEGSVASLTQVSAEQWLIVPKADSIKCTAISSYGTTRLTNVGLEEYKNPLITGDYVTLTGYYGRAVTTGASVYSGQTATSGAANLIKIYGSAKDSSGTSSLSTSLKGISDGRAIFQGLSGTASTGNAITNQVMQKEHVHGTFTSTASYAPTIGTAQSKTRTSNYGSEYDISMRAAKGSAPTGTLGYYVSPTLKIQGAVNSAQSKDTINVAAGAYRENVKIDKSLTVKGAGSTKTIVDGNKAASVFTIGQDNSNVDVILSGLTIQNGYSYCGGGVNNHGRTTVTSCIVSGSTAKNYGGGICNFGKATVTGSTISGNTAVGSSYILFPSGGGIYNSGQLVVQASTISKNYARIGGGISIYGGTGGTATVTGSTISGNSAVSGGGISNSGILTVTGSTISGNTATDGVGGGISNSGTATVMSSIISGNKAKQDGGGIDNEWKLFVGGTTRIINNQATTGYGGGIYSAYNAITFDGTNAAVKYNKAHLPSLSELNWCRGWGIYVYSGSLNKTGGFNPAIQVTGNTHI